MKSRIKALLQSRAAREIAVFLVVLVLADLVVPRFSVAGPSMEPAFHNDERLIISRVNYLFGDPERGDIVVFNSPESGIPLIKRVIGVPGDTIEFRSEWEWHADLRGQLYINGVRADESYVSEACIPASCQPRAWLLGPGEYFVMGDNRNHSNDSRSFGAITRDRIVGEVLLRYWPPEGWGLLKPQGDER